MKYSRNSPFSVEFPKEYGNILTMFGTIEDGILIVSENGIISFKTAEYQDPNNLYPQMKHSYSIVYKINNCKQYANYLVIFSRLNNQVKSDSNFNNLWVSTKYLLDAISAFINIKDEINKYQNIQINSTNRIISAPSINLNEIPGILHKLQKFLYSFANFILKYYECSTEEKNKNLFESITKFNHVPDTIKHSIENEEGKISFLIGLRNSIEHEKQNYFFKVKNFSIDGDNNLRSPTIEFDLSHDQKLSKNFDFCKEKQSWDLIEMIEALIQYCTDFINNIVQLISDDEDLKQRIKLENLLKNFNLKLQ